MRGFKNSLRTQAAQIRGDSLQAMDLEPLESRLQLSAPLLADAVHSIPLGGMSEATVGDTAIFYNGDASQNPSAAGSVAMYDGHRKHWSAASLSTARSYVDEVSRGTIALFAGGYDANYVPSARVDIFDSSGRRAWSTGELSQARAGMTTAVAGHLVFFAGGTIDSHTSSDAVDIYNTRTGRWFAAKLSHARSGMTATVARNAVIFAGGSSAGTLSNAVDIFDLRTGLWSSRALANSGTPKTAVVGKKVLFLGDAKQVANVDIYDSRTGSWSIAALSQTRGKFAIAVEDGKVLLAGGSIFPDNYDLSNPPPGPVLSDVVDVYDSKSDRWSTARLSEARATPDVVIAQGIVMFAGGDLTDWRGFAAIDRINSPSNVVDIYNSRTGEWSAGTLFSFPSRFVNGIAAGHRVFFAGGFYYRAPDDINIYDIWTGRWSTAKLSQARYGIAQVNLGPLTLFAGGRAFWMGPPYANVDVYDSRTGMWSTTSLSHPAADNKVLLDGQAIFYGDGTAVDVFSLVSKSGSTAQSPES